MEVIALTIGLLIAGAVYLQPTPPSPERGSDLLMQCSVACGEDKMKSYNITHGKCVCQENK